MISIMILQAVAILTICPGPVYSSIKVDVVASEKMNDRQIHLSGSIIDIISNQEIESFHLTDEDLKRAVNTYFGAKPANVFLRSPTPWGDLYKTYGWTEVTRILLPLRARILGVQSESTIVLTQIFNNTSTKKAIFSTEIQQKVENTIISTWTKGGNLNVTQGIHYNFDIKVVDVSGSTSFTYTANWGESVSKAETVTVGTQSGVVITLEPNESVVAELSATHGTMKIQVDYEASLDGSVAINYPDGYRGHHFWSFDVNSVMSAGGMNRTNKSTETIHLGYYSDSKIILRDANTSDILATLPAEII